MKESDKETGERERESKRHRGSWREREREWVEDVAL